MANYEIQGPDGKTYEIDAPDIQSATAAFKKFYVPQPLNEDDRETRATNPGLEFAQGGWLPISKTKGTGEINFDLRGGVIGSILDAFGEGSATMKGVAEGIIDPVSQEAISGTIPAVTMMTPISAASRAAAVVPGTLKTLRPGPVAAPTADALKAAGGAGLDAARNLGVDYSAAAVKSMGDELTQALNAAGFFPEVAPKTFSLLSKIGEVPAVEPGATALSSLDNVVTLRKALGKAAGDVLDPTEAKAATRAIEALDKFVMEPPPASVVAGPAAAAGPLLGEARGNYAAAMRSNTVTDAAETAQRDALAANSGLNVGNRTRQIVNSILKSDKESRGFSEPELKLMDEIVRGKHGINLARWAANLFGGGGGMGAKVASGAGMAVGGMMGGFPGAGVGAVAAPAVGLSLKALENKLTTNQIKMLDDMVRKRSPLFMKAQETPPVLEGLRPDVRAAVLRGLMLSQTPGLQNQ